MPLKRPLTVENEAASTFKKQKPAIFLPMDTPLSRNSNSYAPASIHESALTEGTKESIARKQTELKEEMKHELGEVLYEGNWVRDHFCPSPAGRSDKVMQRLIRSRCIQVSQDKVTIAGWPTQGESNFYEPFAELLNNIVKTIEQLSKSNDSPLKGVRFQKHDKEMRETVLGEDPVKPDIIGYKDLGSGDRASWYKTYFVGEVKGNWGQLIAQAATYARCLFAAREHRFFVPMIFLNHLTSEFRLAFYHRCGVLATTVMDISTRNGFRDLVSTFIGIWGWDSRQSAGFDPHQTHSHVVLNDQAYRISRVLCRRQVIHGRATCVFVLVRNDLPSAPELSKHKFLPSKPNNAKNHPIWRRLNPFDGWTADVPTESQTVQFSGELPDTFILKCSHMPHEREDEEQIFKAVQGYVGIPHILGAYDASCLNIPEDKEIVLWNPFDKLKSRPYLHRRHRHLLVQTIGRPLESAKSPRELGEGLLHAMIGHCALFTDGHYLHRDISTGNIILLDKIEQRKVPAFLSNLVQSGACRAVLIDGDVAKEWGSTSKSRHRSGTKPFISKRVTELWAGSKEYIHTPIDDLESFLWVLIYTLLALAELEEVRDIGWWNTFNSDNLNSLMQMKGDLMFNCMQSAMDTTGPFTIFGSLLKAWANEANHYAIALRKLLATEPSLDQIKTLSLEAYCKYIGAAQKHVPNLPEKWDLVDA